RARGPRKGTRSRLNETGGTYANNNRNDERTRITEHADRASSVFGRNESRAADVIDGLRDGNALSKGTDDLARGRVRESILSDRNRPRHPRVGRRIWWSGHYRNERLGRFVRLVLDVRTTCLEFQVGRVGALL